MQNLSSLHCQSTISAVALHSTRWIVRQPPYRSGRRHIYDHRCRQRYRRSLLRDRHARASRRRSRPASSRLRRNLHSSRRRVASDLPRSEIHRARWEHSQYSIQRPAPVSQLGLSPVRMICICSPAGIDRFFQELGVPVATRTTLPPKLDGKQMAEFLEKARAIAPKYQTELLAKA
jgi:hypothetical protein